MRPTQIRFYLLLTVIVLSVSQLSAQNFRTNFKGTVYDETDLPVPGATLLVLNKADSVLVQYATSNTDGTFMIKSVPRGDYLLQVSFLGMEPAYLPISSGMSTDTDLGKIIMKPENTLLKEVQVKADHLPMEIKKDTITYNADAFQTQPDAVVEDLLKKLPGVEVNPDGSIKAQGENVEKVLVDGKEFFGDDPKAATKNLPAKSIKKVKVYDKKSDIAEFTGVDDGEREKTIDLQLKEEFKKGLFGKAEAGYGSNERYNAKASFNRFSKTVQLAFLGQYNNINEQGFSWTDQMAFSGNSFGGGRGGEFRSNDIPFEGLGTGLITTGAGGLNFNWQKSKKFNLRSSYFINNINSSLNQIVLRDNLSEIPFDTEENSEKLKTNLSHRFAFNSEIKPDSLHEVNINGRINFGNGSEDIESIVENFIPGASLESESNTILSKSSDNLSANANASFVRRFDNKGQNIAATFSFSKNENDSENLLEALTRYYNTGQTDAIDQLQYAISDNINWSINGSLTQPLNKRRFLEFNYLHSVRDADYNKEVSDFFDTNPVPNPLLSNSYSSLYIINTPGMTFRYSGEVDNVNISMQYQLSELRGNESNSGSDIVKQYKHFLPRIIWRKDIANGKHLRVSYNTRVNAPSITQLSPAIDNTDPLRVYEGNPDLNAEFNHSGGINYHSFTQFNSTSFFISLNGGLTDNKIINSKTIDAQFREVSKPVNIDNELYANIYSSFGRPFKPIHSRFNININASYTNTQASINNSLLDLDIWSKSGGISFNNLNSEVFEYNFGGQWTFSDSYYKTDESLNQSTLLQSYFADATLTLWKKWRIRGSYNYNLYKSDLFPNQALPLLKASLSRFILPKDRGQLILSVFDALDKNRGLSRSAQPNFIEEIRSNSIGRYLMLTFAYNIRGAGEEPPGTPRHMGRRR